ncbi:MAG: SCO family protein [Gemmatimonadaceae bacterium]
MNDIVRGFRRSRGGLVALLLAAAAAGCGEPTSALPFYRTAMMTPEWLSDREANSPNTHRVAIFALTDQNGATVSRATLEGKVTVVSFFFTRCGDVCPTTTRNIARLLRDLAGDENIQVLSHSVTPDRDSVPALHTFANSHEVTDGRWHLLTGRAGDISRLARESYFVRLGSDSTYGVETIAHTESVLLVDGCGRLRGVYAGTLQLEMQRLREDVNALERDRCTSTRLGKL